MNLFGQQVGSHQIVASICFFLAILHTFLVRHFHQLAKRFPSDSVARNTFHLLGEVEVVFGIWAAVYLVFLTLSRGVHESLTYLESRNFTEPAFVFVTMSICATRPILEVTSRLLSAFSRFLPFSKSMAFYIVTLIVGPILGSLITEPAAMTVTALILYDFLNKENVSDRLKYATIGVLFVNISIGGTLTSYAAPPVLMVAPVWGWDTLFMLKHFGWKAVIAIILSTSIVCYRFRKDITSLKVESPAKQPNKKLPIWTMLLYLLILGGVIVSAHHPIVFVGIFLFFLGITDINSKFEIELNLRQGLLVAFFLAGLVVLGGPQRWWLEPVLLNLDTLPLYFGAISMTALADNAAITYLGSQVPSLSELSKYALVAGAVTGGGLTVIANAPNPAGYGILDPLFGDDGISPVSLFLSALLPTIIAASCFWFF